MILEEFNIKTGPKRIYGSGPNKKTIYLECEITNNLTGKTIKGPALIAPIKNQLLALRNNLNWKN